MAKHQIDFSWCCKY